MSEQINGMIAKIKQQKPLVLNITNDVTMDFIANGLLSLGASPVMSQASQEMEDLLKLASVLVINLGTLDERFIQLCERACTVANQLNKPILFDPVGVGASDYRTEIAKKFMNNYRISVLHGNASEVMALSGLSIVTKGVDSTMKSEQAIESAKMLSSTHECVVVMTGQTDIIIDGQNIERSDRGSPMMALVTGTGCLLTSVLGAFHAVENNRFSACLAATVFYGVCGEIAAKNSQGPGSFRMAFLDALHV